MEAESLMYRTDLSLSPTHHYPTRTAKDPKLMSYYQWLHNNL